MDLRLLEVRPTGAERAAVDGLLGPPASGWDGGERRTGVTGNVARGGHHARARRDQLLPALLAVQERVGWISPGALNYVCQRLTVPPADAYGVASFYALLSLEPRPSRVVHVCDDLACRCSGSDALIAELEDRLGPEGAVAEDGGAVSAWFRSPCLGQCDRAPAALLTIAGDEPEEHVLAPARGALPGLEGAAVAVDPAARVPQQGEPGLRLLRRVGRVDPRSLDDYRAHGGYAALRRACELGPEGVIREVARLEAPGPGRRCLPDRTQVGGRRAPTGPTALPGLQRRRVGAGDLQGPRDHGGRPVRADRGDDDRRVRDGLRARLHLPARRVPAGASGSSSTPLREARRRGYLGDGHRRAWVRIRHRDPAGEPAPTSAARRPRSSTRSRASAASRATSRPSRSTRASSASRPSSTTSRRSSTCSTSCWRAAPPTRRSARTRPPGRSSSASPGTSSGPGVYEVPFGSTLGEMLALAGGVRGGRSLQAVLLGGAAGGFVRPDELDLPLSFEGARAASATLGSGVVLVFDDTVDLPRMLMRIAAFFRDESCGQCVPCRVGTVRQEEALARLLDGRGRGRRARADRRGRPVHAGRVDLRARADGLGRDRVGHRAPRRLRWEGVTWARYST